LASLKQKSHEDPRTFLDTARKYRAVVEHLGAERGTGLSELELGRIQATIAMIPNDVTTILDVGCGDGRIIERLPKRYKTVGVDYSCNSLRQFVQRRVCANSANLPFRDRSFDLVLCCEVLEHLPDELFEATRCELERISRRYILISVPYKENMRLLATKCPRCHHVFHIWGHVRRFLNGDLDSMFVNHEAGATKYFGERRPYYSRAVLYINQRLGHRWTEFDKTTMCPNCGNTDFARTPRNLITMVCGAINLLTSKLIPVSCRSWVLKLYIRRGK